MNNLYLMTGIGGAIGAMTRLFISKLLTENIMGFPFQIFFINVIGCFIMGFISELIAFYWSPSDQIRHLLIPGFLGGFTTFSSFSLEFALLFQKNMYLVSVLYAFISVFLGIIAFFIGSGIIKIVAQ